MFGEFRQCAVSDQESGNATTVSLSGSRSDTDTQPTAVQAGPQRSQASGQEKALLGELTLRLEQDDSVLPTLASDSDDLAAVVDADCL
jgi:hypothetical protein